MIILFSYSLDSETNRPIVGFVVINEAYIRLMRNEDYKSQISTLVHEIFHILFFSPDLFKLFPKNSMNQDFYEEVDENLAIIKGDHIVQAARSHFNCKSIDSGTSTYACNQLVPLENNGGLGSRGGHFEKLIFGDEMMTANFSTDSILSVMTLAVAKDSDWYEVDLSLGEQFFWGKDEGCGIFQAKCSEVSEFCMYRFEYECSDNHVYNTICHQSPFAPECKIKINIQNCKKNNASEIKAFSHGRDAVCLPLKVGYIYYD